RRNCSSERSNTVTFAPSNAKAADCCPPPLAKHKISLPTTLPSRPSGSTLCCAEIGSRCKAGRVNKALASTNAFHLSLLYFVISSINDHFLPTACCDQPVPWFALHSDRSTATRLPMGHNQFHDLLFSDFTRSSPY